MEADLRDTISRHLDVILGGPTATAGGLALQDSLKALDSILIEYGAEMDVQLRHYLENRSYLKAQAHLNA